jgi:hypothetical protein
VLGYPKHLLSTLHQTIGYPSPLSKCYRATVRPRWARILPAHGRLINFDSGIGIHCGQMHTEARYPVSGKNILGRRSGLVVGLWFLLENGNTKKFSQYFLSKLSFDKLSCVFCILPWNFFWIFVKIGFSSSSVGYHGISNQFFICFMF